MRRENAWLRPSLRRGRRACPPRAAAVREESRVALSPARRPKSTPWGGVGGTAGSAARRKPGSSRGLRAAGRPALAFHGGLQPSHSGARVRVWLVRNEGESRRECTFKYFLFFPLPAVSVDGVCSVASCVGKELAPHVKKHGVKLVPESLRKDRDGKSPLDGAMVVAASSVQGSVGRPPHCPACVPSAACAHSPPTVSAGFSTVWQGLECAAKCIVHNVSAETVQTVRHK